MSEQFKPGEFVTDGVTVLMVYEGELTPDKHCSQCMRPWLEPGHIWLSRRGGDSFQSGIVSRKVSDLRRATCDEIFNSCVHGKLRSAWPCETCAEKGLEPW